MNRALVGPTASGKTQAALDIAERLGCEVLSVDSMLVYRGMDVGTAKPRPDERARVHHHLINVVEPEQPFSVAEFQFMARSALDVMATRGVGCLIVGGSGLYYRAVVDDLEFPGTDPETRRNLETEAVAGGSLLYSRLEDLDPDAARKIEPANVRRTVRALEVAAVTGRPFSTYSRAWEAYPEGNVRAAGITMQSEALAARIERRVRSMLDAGFLDEVRGLIDRGLGGWLTSSQAIGYAEMALHIRGELPLEDAISGTVKRTKALARRQLAWFRRDPRIEWFEAGAEGAGAIADRLTEYLDG